MTSLDKNLTAANKRFAFKSGGFADDTFAVVNMARLVLRPGDEAPAAGFWSLPPDSPLRKRHLGTFNDAWLKTSWPHLPDDTQPAYFNVAPPDQRLGGFFRGDEKIVLHNMGGAQPGRWQHLLLRQGQGLP